MTDIEALIAEARDIARHGNGPQWESDATDVIDRLADALEAVSAERDEAVSLRNRAYRQRDDERAAKEGNVRALNTALTERDEALAVIAEIREWWYSEEAPAVKYSDYLRVKAILSRIPEHPKEGN